MMRISIRREQFRGASLAKSGVHDGTPVFLEYIGNAAARANIPHASSHKQTSGTARTFHATKKRAFDARKNNNQKPIIAAVKSRMQIDPRKRFASNRQARDATRGAASHRASNDRAAPLGDLEVAMARLVEETLAEEECIPGFVKILQSVVGTGDDIVIGCWSKASLAVIFHLFFPPSSFVQSFLMYDINRRGQRSCRVMGPSCLDAHRLY